MSKTNPRYKPNRKAMYRDKFNWFTSTSFTIIAIDITLYALYYTGGKKAMIAQLPPFFWFILSLAGIALIMAFYNAYKGWREPSDTRLDELIEAMKELKQPQSNSNSNLALGIALIIKAIGDMKNSRNDK